MKRLNIIKVRLLTTILSCFFVSPIYTFFLAGNKIVYTPRQGTNREKY